jgi:hypothetical protein
MKKYKFHTVISDEAIGVCKANNIDEAQQYFAVLKKLPLEKFLSIYIVTTCD